MTKSQIVKKIMSLAGDTSAATKAKLNALGVAQLKDVLAAAQQSAKQVPAKRASAKKPARAQGKKRAAAKRASAKKPAKAQGKKQAAKKPARAAKPKAQGQKRKPTKRGSVRSLSKATVSRAAAVTRAIASGKIAMKQGKKSVSDMAGATARARYTAFLKLYSKARIKGRKSGAKAASVKQRYAAIGGSKTPYYLSAGYTVKQFSVGGGAKGPGVIRAIPGSNAKSFSAVADAQKAKIAGFLNGAGKSLRSKGAPAVVNLAEIKRLAGAKSAKKGRASAKKTGTANWW